MEQKLSRTEASEAIGDAGWRFLLGTLRTSVPIGSLTEGAQIVSRAVEACGDDADQHLHIDLRPTRVILTLQSLAHAAVTTRDTDLAHRISAAVHQAGSQTEPDLSAEAPRSVQLVELGIDALDIAAIRPFWKAVLGYTAEPGADGPEAPLVDPLGQGPAIWFQQMDHPRPQRNRIHLDICVPHDEAPTRLKAALSAGGNLLSDHRAPAFWVLSDPEGNEACITTWQARDN